jgi:hypothetical protein
MFSSLAGCALRPNIRPAQRRFWAVLPSILGQNRGVAADLPLPTSWLQNRVECREAPDRPSHEAMEPAQGE